MYSTVEKSCTVFYTNVEHDRDLQSLVVLLVLEREKPHRDQVLHPRCIVALLYYCIIHEYYTQIYRLTHSIIHEFTVFYGTIREVTYM